MPQMATGVTINDGATTPVATVFSPDTQDGMLARFANRAASIPAGFKTISHEVRRPTSAGAAQRIIIGFNLPVVETVNGIATVTRYSSAKVELNIANGSTLQERKDLLAFVANYLDVAEVKTSVQNVEPWY